jgi:glycosyltransferase involved in cell wall biosynthesis
MESFLQNRPLRLSVVIPCYNEERTIQTCIERLMVIGDRNLELEVIFVDDCSTDKSLSIAEAMTRKHPELVVIQHNRNLGKGAALRLALRMSAVILWRFRTPTLNMIRRI